MSLRLITNPVLDAYEAERFQRDAEAAEASRQARLDLATFYEIAVHAGDELEVRRIEALAADIDAHNPFGPRLLDELTGHADHECDDPDCTEHHDWRRPRAA